ncbi:MAG: ABC transporter ATP-binding protein [Planctomycetaceae bacterium]|nr:macrolide ABC transporter ATP-binding protein [Planctomycetota bacterium]NUO16368.1 ABC transporter ATP-binding protein [Planctomycetaceae bacterium]GIK53132.1 MAG: macrolide ABC transporter ATP-binding protein [Planctomycetota bacterium]
MIVQITDVWRQYRMGGAEPVAALRGATLAIEAGEFTCLLGKSGSGKSTLMNLIGGLDRPTKGSIEVDGIELSRMSARELSLYRREKIGFVFQSFNLVGSMRAWENVSLPLVFAGVPRAERKRRADEMLERVGLARRADHRPTQLSGGEQQRVAFARALISHPRILLGDEPTGNLDSATSEQIMALMVEENRRGTTIIMVTHDPDLAERYASRIVRMADGAVVGDTRREKLFATEATEKGTEAASQRG